MDKIAEIRDRISNSRRIIYNGMLIYHSAAFVCRDSDLVLLVLGPERYLRLPEQKDFIDWDELNVVFLKMLGSCQQPAKLV